MSATHDANLGDSTDTTAPTAVDDAADARDAAAMLAPLGGLDPGTAARLHERLVRDAVREGILDVGYRTLDTPIGSLLLAASERGLVRVAFAVEGHDHVLEVLARTFGPRILHAPARLDDAAREVDEYFGGTRRSFDLALDLGPVRGYRREVLDRLAAIPYGRTESYAEVARSTSSPRAVRAVGTACATNPLPIVVPCHRVVRSDGASGQYLGGADTKRALLALEAGA